LKIKLKQIRPNPFRRIERYPLVRSKVEALKASIQKTEFWDNLMVRRDPEKEGFYQSAFGEHRKAALLELYGREHEIEASVRRLSDEAMLRIMALENMEEWGGSALVEIETVHSVVLAFAEGKIELPKPSKDTSSRRFRCAPSFARGDVRPGRPYVYTAQTVSEFLGWVYKDGESSHKVETALGALELIELGLLEEKDFAELSHYQCRELVSQTLRLKAAREKDIERVEATARHAKQVAETAPDPRERERATREHKSASAFAEKIRDHSKKETVEVARTLGKELRSGEISSKQARERANELYEPVFVKEKAPPYLHQVAKSVAAELNHILLTQDTRTKKIREIIEFRDQLDNFSKEILSGALTSLSRRAAQLVEALNQPINNGSAGKPAKSAPPRELK
jgi:hypothetical protein